MPRAIRFVAVVDIGKTNAKVVLHDLLERRDLGFHSVVNEVRQDGPYPHFDLDRLFAFVLDSIRRIAALHPIDAISITTHGASAVLIDDSGLALPMIDYEFDISGPESDEYETIRPPFSETQSPSMGAGLNVGRQLFWLQRRFPDEFARTRHIMTYPQYWVWKLTGELAFEPTSVGCHTDLWNPARNDFSSLVDRMGWRPLFATRRQAFDVVAPLRTDLAARIGMSESDPLPVLCGIHDSNASLLPHLLSRQTPFSVVSTGTWVVSFSIGGRAIALRPGFSTMANVDAFGRPVPSGIFMGGREFDLLTERSTASPTADDIAKVIDRQIMAHPGQTPGTGPFPHAKGGWSQAPASLSPTERCVAASLYAALSTQAVLELIGAEGTIVVEGPFARNPIYLSALRQLTQRKVSASADGTGTSAGAALLALGPDGALASDDGNADDDAVLPDLSRYRAAWLARAEVQERELTP
ncbi:FGGY-family carbohydrate kinase [Aureimonas sp. ME7]|uniref:FGGY-family carbohydrate kinase n=1 Tax=Aureimonas sp. ME7 TaxID=2744252 RepID=UPI0015F65139|nr:FGGY-family carbohydrate kinase [Aureimonas sp. ME7]